VFVIGLRVRAFVPEPHVCVHEPHEPQGPITQSTGHGSIEQESDSLRTPQAVPPLSGVVVGERERAFVPPPHVMVHADQADHAERTQWTGHEPLLQTCVWLVSPQAAPPWAIGVAIARERVCVPAPHVLEHAPHVSHGASTQSMGQASLLHDWVPLRYGHTWPPSDASVMIVRERLWLPPPHVFVHVLHVLNSDTVQCTGHPPRLQVPCSVVAPHATPPKPAAVVTVRERDLVPWAQVIVHALQSVHVPITQSTGHACTLHPCDSSSTGQATPPSAGCVVTVRERVCEPVPHDLVQLDHASKPPQAETTQSTGQATELHARVSLEAAHATPPLDTGVATGRERTWVPVLPQLTEQAPHAPQVPIVQSTGHSAVPHACVSESAGHTIPPYTLAMFMLRERPCDPVPHVLEQEPQLPHDDTTQSIGQACVLHGCTADVAGQSTPPCAAAVVTVRTRVCTPLPQVCEQKPHAAHADIVQSTGQGSGLQASEASSAGHVAPP
jgi:hypothetical protein